MSKPFAINRFTLTKPLFLEGYAIISKKQYGRASAIAIGALTLAWIALAVVTIALGQSPLFILLEFAVIFAAALWILFFFPRHKAKRAWNKMEERYGEDLERTAEFYEGRLIIRASDYETIIAYDTLERLYETPNLIVLVNEDKVGVMLLKEGFIAGSEAKVKETLKMHLVEEKHR